MNAALRIAAWLLAIALVALPVVAVVNGWIGAERWPLTRLRVQGELTRVDPAQLQATVLPYAKRGFIDHQTLSFDAYLKFIEDRFLGGERLPGKPVEPRPTVREDLALLGDLRRSFNFTQEPRPPLILNPLP